MSRDSIGTYSLPSGNPVVAGTVCSASDMNSTLDDLAAEIQDSLSRSGKGGMLADLPMGSNRITNLGTPVASTDGATKGYVDSNVAASVGVASTSVGIAGPGVTVAGGGCYGSCGKLTSFSYTLTTTGLAGTNALLLTPNPTPTVSAYFPGLFYKNSTASMYPAMYLLDAATGFRTGYYDDGSSYVMISGHSGDIFYLSGIFKAV